MYVVNMNAVLGIGEEYRIYRYLAGGTSDKHKATLALVMRLNLEAQYGANDLYSGMGATIQDNTGGLGAREVMLSQNDTKFALTDDNHKLVDLGQYTAADVEHSYSRPPSAPSSGGSK